MTEYILMETLLLIAFKEGDVYKTLYFADEKAPSLKNFKKIKNQTNTDFSFFNISTINKSKFLKTLNVLKNKKYISSYEEINLHKTYKIDFVINTDFVFLTKTNEKKVKKTVVTKCKNNKVTFYVMLKNKKNEE